jgi:hypothetical protein
MGQPVFIARQAPFDERIAQSIRRMGRPDDAPSAGLALLH